MEAVGRADVAPFGVDAGRLEATAAAVIRRLEPLLGVSPEDLVEVQRSHVAGLFAIQLEQEHGGVPIDRSRIDLRFAEAGELLFLRLRGLWSGTSAPAFVVTRAEAGEFARVAVPSGSTEAFAHETRRVLLAEEDPSGPARPAWRVSVDDPTNSAGLYAVTIDGIDGTILTLGARRTRSTGPSVGAG